MSGDVCSVSATEAKDLVARGIAEVVGMKKDKRHRMITGRGVKQK